MTHEWILSTALGRARCPRPRFVRNQVLCSNLRIVGVARAAAAAGVTAQAGRGRASAIPLKREEAEQADGPSRGPKGAPQELGCLPDLTAQNNNEKTGQRIHDFEISIDYSSRERGLSRTRLASTTRSKKREHEWMSCRRNFSREQPLRRHSRRRKKDHTE